MSIEAMKLALEALEIAAEGGGVNFHGYAEDLRQAIAEAEKQEPVAHFESTYVNENGVHITTVLGPVAIPQDAKLYTHPQPKREPLTDEQIDHITAAFPTWLFPVENQRRDCDRAIARAIEAAHGIKGEA